MILRSLRYVSASLIQAEFVDTQNNLLVCCFVLIWYQLLFWIFLLLGQYRDRTDIVFLTILLFGGRDTVMSQDVSMVSSLYGQNTIYCEGNTVKLVKSQLFRLISSNVLHNSTRLNLRFSKRSIRAVFHFQTLVPSQLQYLIEMHPR